MSFLRDDHQVQSFDSTRKVDDVSLPVQELRLSLTTENTGQRRRHMVWRRLLRQTSPIVLPRLQPPLPSTHEASFSFRTPEGKFENIQKATSPTSFRTPTELHLRSDTFVLLVLTYTFHKASSRFNPRRVRTWVIPNHPSQSFPVPSATGMLHIQHRQALSFLFLKYKPEQGCTPPLQRHESTGECRWPLHTGHYIPSRFQLRCTVLTERQCICNRAERQVSSTCRTTKTPSVSWVGTVPQGPLGSS